jgi:broad specificity phosphatase PhoE
MSQLYIRHSFKEYKNGKNEEFSLDPDITEEGKLAAREKFIMLVNTYGVPNQIISSPYLRARTTAHIAADVILELTGKQINITCDRYVGECLEHQIGKDLNVCLRPETLQHRPIPPETKQQFNKRMFIHTKKAKQNVWYILHGRNIYTIASIKKQKIQYPAELCGIHINDDGIITTI